MRQLSRASCAQPFGFTRLSAIPGCELSARGTFGAGLFLGLSLLLATLTGCTWAADLDSATVEALQCSAQSPCQTGFTCAADGFCVPENGGGDVVDTTVEQDTIFDTYRDTAHPDLGECSTTCKEGDTCCFCGAERCLNGQICCLGTLTGATCVDLDNDGEHCGACGVGCGTGETCSGGACACGGTISTEGAACTIGDYCCDGTCLDETVSCECSASSPCSAVGHDCCGGACVNMSFDPLNCGSCGTRCSDLERCVTAACECAEGLIDCGTGCIDTQVDPENCGACAAPCAPQATCLGGSCAP